MDMMHSHSSAARREKRDDWRIRLFAALSSPWTFAAAAAIAALIALALLPAADRLEGLWLLFFIAAGFFIGRNTGRE